MTMIPEADDSSRHGRSHDDETLTAGSEGGRNGLTSENGWSAWASGGRYAAGEPRLEIGDEIETLVLDHQRRIFVSRCVSEAIEGEAVTARKAMGYRGRCCIVPVSDMRDGVDRERQQQSCEGNSQPLGRSSGQMHQVHVRQRMTDEQHIGYGEAPQL
jgi:hypothetical protein